MKKRYFLYLALFISIILSFQSVFSDNRAYISSLPFSRTADSETFLENEHLKTSFYPSAINTLDSNGNYVPFETNTIFTSNTTNMTLTWNNKRVFFDFFVYNGTDIQYLKDMSLSQLEALDVKTYSSSLFGLIHYNHTLLNRDHFTLFGYNITTENVTCSNFTTSFICDDKSFDYATTVEQGISVNISSNQIIFYDDTELLFIDPAYSVNYSSGTMFGFKGSSSPTSAFPNNVINPITASFGAVTASNLVAPEDTRETFLVPASGNGVFLFNMTTNISKEDINNISILWEGSSTLSENMSMMGFMWNYTASNWTQCIDIFNLTSTDVQKVCSFTGNVSQFINNSYMTFLVWTRNPVGSGRTMREDFIRLDLTYDDIIINTPVNNQEVLNTLSTTLNTTQTLYNQTLLYSFSNGIKNYSLCTNSNYCQATITFPRQGYYNLTIYGNSSTGALRVKNITNIYVTNYTNYNYTAESNIKGYDCIEPTSTTSLFKPNELANCNTLTDQTSNAALDADDTSRFTPGGQAGSWKAFYAIINIQEDVTKITSLNATLIGFGDGNVHNFTLFNVTADGFKISQSQSVPGSSEVAFQHYLTSGFNDVINSTNKNMTLVYYRALLSSFAYSIDFFQTAVYSRTPNSLPNVKNLTANNTIFSALTNNQINYNVTDDNDYVINSTIYVYNSTDLIFNQTTSYPSLGVSNSFSVNVSTDGTYYYQINATDSDNTINSTQILTFIVAVSPPSISIITPLNNSNTTNPTLNVNYTLSQTTLPISACWYTRNAGVSNNSITCGNNLTGITWNEGMNNVTIYTNDTLNHINSSSVTFRLDTSLPKVNMLFPLSGTNHSSPNLNVNYSTSDTDGFSDITSCKWSKNGGVSNTTLASCQNTSDTFAEGLNTIYIWATENTGNEGQNSSTFRVDTISPTVTITAPTDGQAFGTNTIQLNYTVSDSGSGVASCVYRNNTDANKTITCGTNTTISQATDGAYTVTVCVNDTVGNIACDTNSWSISTGAPAITKNYPTNNLGFNSPNNIQFNFTATDSDGVSSCSLYGNWTGSFILNKTQAPVTSGLLTSFGLFNMSSNDATYKWNIFCNDTLNNGAFSSSNFTFFIDSTRPSASITSIQTTQDSQTVRFNHTASDSNSLSCFYSVFNSTNGIDGSLSNISTTCNENNTQFVVSSYGTFNLTFYALDVANNLGISSQLFTTSITPPSPPSSGGGGGGLSLVSQIPVIALEPIDNPEQTYNELERAIMFAVINNYCAKRNTGEDTATRDYSDVCFISVEDLPILKDKLTSFEVLTTNNDISKFFQNYKNKKYVQVFATLEEINEYELFSSVLGLVTKLQIKPNPNYDSYFTLFDTSFKNTTIPIILTSNKKLSSCLVLSQAESLSCEIENLTIKIKYSIPETNFLSRVFSGQLIVTTDAEPEKVEQQRINLTLRVINLASPRALGTGAVALTVIVAISFLIIKKRKSKLTKEIKGLASLG